MGLFDILFGKKKRKNIRDNIYIPAIECFDNCSDIHPTNELVRDTTIVKSIINKISSSVSTAQFNIYQNNKYVKEIYIEQKSLIQLVEHLITYGYVNYQIKYSQNNKYQISINDNSSQTIEILDYDGNNKDLVNRLGVYLSKRLIHTDIYLNNFIRNSNNFGILSFKPNTDHEPFIGVEQIELNKSIKEKLTGQFNSFNVRAVPYEVNYIDIVSDFNKVGLLEIINKNREDVCNIFSIPSIIMNDMRQSTYNNLTEAYKRFYSECLFFYLDLISEALTNSLKDTLKVFGNNTIIYYNKKKYLINDFRDKLLSDLTIEKIVELGILDTNELKDILFF